MDTETLYYITKAAAQGAENALAAAREKDSQSRESFGGYPVYVEEYNRLVPMVVEIFGDEAQQQFPLLDLGSQHKPANTMGALWEAHLKLAADRLRALAIFLKKHAGGAESDRKLPEK